MAWQQATLSGPISPVRLSAFTRLLSSPITVAYGSHFFLDWLHDSGERGVQPLKHIKGFKDLWFGVRKGRWGIQ